MFKCVSLGTLCNLFFLLPHLHPSLSLTPSSFPASSFRPCPLSPYPFPLPSLPSVFLFPSPFLFLPCPLSPYPFPLSNPTLFSILSLLPSFSPPVTQAGTMLVSTTPEMPQKATPQIFIILTTLTTFYEAMVRFSSETEKSK